MPEFPSSVPVKYPILPTYVTGASMETYLFRYGNYLVEAFDLAAERLQDKREMVVVSAGCSTGAEADSILAIHRRLAKVGSIALTGFDIGADVIKRAQSGEHVIDIFPLQHHEDVLSDLGFLVSWQAREWHSGAARKERLVADSKFLRAGNRVNFVQHDLCELPKEQPEADLILANNLLYHLPLPKAMAVATNLASMLNEKGIISFGDDTFTRKNSNWHNDIVGLLRNEFDLKVIKNGRNGGPAIFGR